MPRPYVNGMPMNLRIPGPTPLPPQVRDALALPMINHRSPQFAAIQSRIVENLKHFFQTQNDILLFTCSGTGGMEACVVNTISPGDDVLAISVGVFGDRFADIAHAFGAHVNRLNFTWGQAADPEIIRAKLREHKNLRVVLVTHNETSTAITNPLREIARVVREESDAILVVDAISSLGAIDLPVDDWGVDVALAGSQKSWMIPPGLTMMSVSPRAWNVIAQARAPRFYFDFRKMRDAMAKGETPATPAVGLYFAIDAALQMMKAEGRENIFARHARVAQRAHQRAQDIGLELFADQAFASNTVTAIKNPPGIDFKKWRKVLREDFNVVIAGGQKDLTDKVQRIGHLGWVTEADIDACFDAIDAARRQVEQVAYA